VMWPNHSTTAMMTTTTPMRTDSIRATPVWGGYPAPEAAGVT
jgi:hypothetical protein